MRTAIAICEIAVVVAAVGAVVFIVFWSLFSQWRRFQMHLLTAVILMFVAGGLMWANMTENGPQGVYLVLRKTPQDNEYRARVIQYGWPFHATEQRKPVLDEKAAGSEFTSPLVVLNIGIAFGILYLVWYGCEWLIRRSEVWKAKPQAQLP